MTSLFNVLTLIGAMLAVAVLFLTMTSAQGAPQEAAGAAFACALVIIPYSVASISQRVQTF